MDLYFFFFSVCLLNVNPVMHGQTSGVADLGRNLEVGRGLTDPHLLYRLLYTLN